jgi:hypothetical protein
MEKGDKIVGKYGNKSILSSIYGYTGTQPILPDYVNTIRWSYRLTSEQKLECELENLSNHVRLFISSRKTPYMEKAKLVFLLENRFGIGATKENVNQVIEDIIKDGLTMTFNSLTFYENIDMVYKKYPEFKEKAEVKHYDLFNERKAVGKK